MHSLKFLATALFPLSGLILFQSTALADTGTLTLTGTPSGSLAGIYTSPYQFNFVDDNDPSKTISLLLSCDTFANEITGGETWDVTTYQITSRKAYSGPTPPLTSGLSTSDVFEPDGTGTGNGVTIAAPGYQEQYAIVAYLATSLMNDIAAQPSGDTTTFDLSYAIWQVFDPSTYLQSGLSSSDQSAIGQDIASAYTATTGFYTSAYSGPNIDVTVFKPTSTPAGHGTPQEFLGVADGITTTTSVPEPSSLALMAFNLFALFGVAFAGRRLFRTAK
jgi:hypothetical protein